MAISTAVGLERISRIRGYGLEAGFFQDTTPNLPQRIAVLGEANTANQSGLSTDKKEITSAQQAAELYGYGSPLHQIFRILRPLRGSGVGGIRTFAFPQVSDVAATASTREWTVTGTATANATHSVIVNGRDNVDLQLYSYTVATGDTPTDIAEKIVTAVNGVLGSPVTASNALGVVTFTTKWKGATSDEVTIRFDIGATGIGVTYAETATTAGAGAVTLSTALDQFGDDWYTVVINPYGSAQFVTLEDFNGTPVDNPPTGRYAGTTFLPFMAYFGLRESTVANIQAVTDVAARKTQVTNVYCPSPNSEGYTWEAAANVARLAARSHQDTPHTDINAKSYPDMPVPVNGDIGDMMDYNNRDVLVKSGASTVILKDGAYQIQDLVTTYHPDGETPLIFSYVRDLNIDFNVAYRYRLLEERFVRDKTLIPDDQVTEVSDTIKPKDWKSIIYGLADELASLALITNPDFMKETLRVEINDNNPNRFEATFDYSRSGLARIVSTNVRAGFQ